MKLLALTLPGGATISSPPGFNANLTSLGGLLSGVFNLVLFAAGFLMLFWMAWGIFEYIFAGGNKEGLTKGRNRITYAIVGFVLVVLAFAIQQFITSIVPTQPIQVTPITPP